MQYHKYSLTELENMMPWERDIYLALLRDYIENENLIEGFDSSSQERISVKT